MAVDGTLIFDTSVDDDGFVKGTAALESAIKGLEKAVKELSVDIKNTFSGTYVGKVTKDIEKQTESVEKHEGVIDKAGKALDRAFDDSLGERVIEETKNIAEATGIAGSFANAGNRIKQVYEGVTGTLAKLFTVDAGRGPIEVVSDNETGRNAQILTDEYAAAQAEAKKLETQLLKLYDRQEKFLMTGGNKSSLTYKRMEYDVSTVESKLETAESVMNRLNEEGRAFKLGSNNQEFSTLQQKLRKAQSATSKLSKMMSGLKRTIAGVAKTAGKMGLKLLSSINPLPKLISSTTGKMGGFAKKIGSLAKRVFVFTVITKALRGIKEAFSNLVSGDAQMKNSLAQIKGNLLTAFAPIYSFILPAIRALMQGLATVTNYIANVMSKIFGKTIAQSTALAKSINKQTAATNKNADATKDANKQLNDYDELQVMQQDSSSGAGDEGIAPSFNATEVEVSWVEQFKKMIEADDWEGIGKTISNKLADTLESIKWNKIKKKCSNVVSKTSRLLNGFFSNMRLASDIGSTISEMLNTGLTTAYTFLKTFKWGKFGQFIGTSLGSAISTFDWTLLGKTLSSFINSGIDFAYGFVTTYPWGQFASGIATSLNQSIQNIEWGKLGTAFGKAVQGIIDEAHTFVTTYNWGSLAKGFSTSINKFFKQIDFNKAGKTVGGAIIGIFNEISTFLQDVDWVMIGKKIAGFFKGIDWGGVASAVFEALGSALGAAVSLIWGAIRGVADSIKKYFSKYVNEDMSWDEIASGILDGIVDGFEKIEEWVRKNIFEPFWTAVLKAFGIEDDKSKKMVKIGSKIGSGLLTGFISPISGVIKALEKVKELIETIQSLTGKKGKSKPSAPLSSIYGVPNFPKSITPKGMDIPLLARGAVIPPRAPFMAMLGDQKRGTNIEAPLDTIRQAVREELGAGGNDDTQIEVNVYLEGEASGVFKMVRTEATKYNKRTGEKAFA